MRISYKDWKKIMNDLRITSLDEMIGQANIIERIKISVESAKMRDDSLAHILLSGNAGLGKTSLAMAIAHEMGTGIEIGNGASISNIKDMLPYLARINDDTKILFIDEIHRLNKKTSETLYTVLEDFYLCLGKKKQMTMELPKFTFIGATTHAGILTQPMRDRFGLKYTLELYSDEDLKNILAQSAAKLKFPIEEDALIAIAAASRGVPRRANNNLMWTRDYVLSHDIKKCDAQVVFSALKLAGIEPDGLDGNDKKYLAVLEKNNGPVGVKTIESMSGITGETLQTIVEPFLLRTGRVAISKRGRYLA